MPVLTLDERIGLLEACKWVDEVVVIDEYAVRLDFMDKHNITFVTHGALPSPPSWVASPSRCTHYAQP